ncbi:flippase-like domain-containing protein [bacterium]|nr:flippase-like domain-containing protein [bacterium]
MFNKKLIKFFIKLIITLLFLWWIIFKIDWQEVWIYLQRVSFLQIGAYVAFYFLGMLVSSYKWKLLASANHIVKVPLEKFFKYYFAATFINNFMPSFVGGDAFKAYRIGKFEKKYKEAVSSVIMDRLTGLWGAMILAIVFAILNLKIIMQHQILSIIIISIIVLLAMSFFAFKNPKVFNIIPIKIIQSFFQKAAKEVNGYGENGNVIRRAVLFSFLFNFIGLAGANYILFLSMDIQVNILNYLSVIFLISIVSSIPVTINNIGVKEWAYITFFGFFGIASSAVLAVAILSRILQMLLSLFSWPIYLRNK